MAPSPPLDTVLPIAPLNATWFGFLAFWAVVGVAIHMALRNRPERTKQIVLTVVAVFNWALSTAFTFNLILDPDIYFPFWQNLPLHFCTIVTFLLIPAIWVKWKPLRTLCYFPGILGAFMALLSPAQTYWGFSVFSLFGFGFFGVHSLNVVLPILLVSLGFYVPSYREALKSLGYFVAVAMAVLPIALIERATVEPGANYFYFFDPEGAEVLVMLHDLIPVPVLYAAPVLPAALGVFVLEALVYKLIHRLVGRVKAGRVTPTEPPLPGDGQPDQPGQMA